MLCGGFNGMFVLWPLSALVCLWFLQAWQNEKFAPELLLPHPELVNGLSEQIRQMVSGTVHAHTHTYTHTHCTHACTYTHTHTHCTHACTHTHTPPHPHTHSHTHTHTHTPTHTHTHTHTHYTHTLHTCMHISIHSLNTHSCLIILCILQLIKLLCMHVCVYTAYLSEI